MMLEIWINRPFLFRKQSSRAAPRWLKVEKKCPNHVNYLTSSVILSTTKIDGIPFDCGCSGCTDRSPFTWNESKTNFWWTPDELRFITTTYLKHNKSTHTPMPQWLPNSSANRNHLTRFFMVDKLVWHRISFAFVSIILIGGCVKCRATENITEWIIEQHLSQNMDTNSSIEWFQMTKNWRIHLNVKH